VLPPRWLRRLVLAPGLVAGTLLLVTTLPVWLLVAAVASPLLPGARWRPLRVLWVLLLHLVLESVLLLSLFGLWIGSGFGRRLSSPALRSNHYELVRGYLRTMFAEAQRVLGVRVSVDGPEPSAFAGRPLVVFSRHAGPGDSFLIVHALMNWYGREPRIVLKETLRWDPAVDVLLGRLPNLFVRPGTPGLGAEVAQLATGLDRDDAFVIFPEGGNFTARRRARAITRLRAKGRLAEAERAERLRHVLAPRPGGVTAALAAGEGADVVWVAHAGLDHLVSVADVWRALPMDSEVRMRWWHVPADEVPRGRDAQVEWLYDWWARIDDWIGQQRG
jgi:1-acyl-sn-glycerol-3-phosphate acyltransferase